ncbi:helix-turn-helix domain-containing protein [Clostridium paraputrificum]|uniref:helix-turn-helix domain-containing protein n=1 Tax=Clostridium paraputrificum TaxID=29363 RepID=UPI00189DB987|nr:helix-turn-helix transcriptional regulator [Clostridium paraputrificum]
MLGDKIKSLRKEKRITQQEVANAIKVSQSTIGMIESGKKTGSPQTLIKLADFFGVTVDYLLSDDKELEKVKANPKTIKNDFPIIPEQFTDPEEARAYVTKHQIFGYGGFDPYRMSDEDILNFANEMINQAELLGYKYMKEKHR